MDISSTLMFHHFILLAPPQLELLIRAKNVEALRDSKFSKVSDEQLLALFGLALRCTTQPTSNRPGMIQVVAELQAAVSDLTAASHQAAKRVDKAVEAATMTNSVSLEDDLARMAYTQAFG